MVTLLKRDKLPFKIKEIWFNGFDQIEKFGDVLGVLQGEYISELITKHNLVHNKSFKGKAIYINDYAKLPVLKIGTTGMVLTLLSPGRSALEKLHATWKEELKKYGKKTNFAIKLGKDKRYDSDDDLLGLLGTKVEELQEKKVTGDTSVPNGSSIAFLATYNGMTCLFAGDATSDYLLKAIDPILSENGKERLVVDAWKIGHHGSKRSTLEKLMTKIKCSKILVSSNGKKFKHPDPETIAKLLKNNGPGLQFYFNYKTEFNERWADADTQKKYKYKACFPKKETKPGITIKLG
jgi:hypothetical protein